MAIVKVLFGPSTMEQLIEQRLTGMRKEVRQLGVGSRVERAPGELRQVMTETYTLHELLVDWNDGANPDIRHVVAGQTSFTGLGDARYSLTDSSANVRQAYRYDSSCPNGTKLFDVRPTSKAKDGVALSVEHPTRTIDIDGNGISIELIDIEECNDPDFMYQQFVNTRDILAPFIKAVNDDVRAYNSALEGHVVDAIRLRRIALQLDPD